MSLDSVAALQAELTAGVPLHELCALEVDGCAVRVLGDSPEVGARLAAYFAPYTVSAAPSDALEVVVLERAPLALDLAWTEWPREAGKRGLKERYHDAPDGRAIHKVRTGMLFLLRPERVVAVGPCGANLNQVINLVNNQVIARHMAEGFALCHAAGVCRGGRGLGLAGVSGAGKSTLALRLVERGAAFVSNDRLLVRREADGAVMRGIPKHPRVNPGTLLSLPGLTPLLPPRRVAELAEMPREELWELEEKYDADIAALFGPERVATSAPLSAFVVLGWSHKDGGATRVERTTLRERPALLETIEKHPGPFFHDAGAFDLRGSVGALPREPYLAAMGDVPVLAISGGVDWLAAVEACEALLGGRA
ncbi:MAG: HprK-related kinase B [Planctomycetes bacterium]|nr:HprK-related kinase B [Planctomycetota bacterium]